MIYLPSREIDPLDQTTNTILSRERRRRVRGDREQFPCARERKMLGGKRKKNMKNTRNFGGERKVEVEQKVSYDV